MKKHKTIPVIMFLMSTSCWAQLNVNYDLKVGIGTETEYFQPMLMVGDHPYFDESDYYNIGIGASAEVMDRNNMGIYTRTRSNSIYSFQLNCGVMGIVEATNSHHGRNFGLSGMINPPANSTFHGGAGIYGSDYDYRSAYPDNITGAYAAFFAGRVAATGNVTSSSMFTLCDSRLSDNITSLNGSREGGRSTLKSLLGMNVIEYNLKPTLADDIPEGVAPERAEMLRGELQRLKQEEKEMTSRRHFGIDGRELQEVYPDLVMEGEDGCLAVNYMEMVPLVIRSIQELKQEMDEMRDAVGEKAKMPLASGIANADTPIRSVLFQNMPNPAREKTVIRFQLADGVRDASVRIYDQGGKLLKKLPVSKGMDSVTINCRELGEGVFLYSLVINGQEVDTKRMLLGK